MQTNLRTPYRPPGNRGDPPALRGGPMILVTGGLGMIGAHTARELIDLVHEVVVIAYRRIEVPSFLADRVMWNPSAPPTGTPSSPVATSSPTSSTSPAASRTRTRSVSPYGDDWPAQRVGRHPHLGRPKVRRRQQHRRVHRSDGDSLARGARAAHRGAAAPGRAFKKAVVPLLWRTFSTPVVSDPIRDAGVGSGQHCS
jgi:hypothetical protein